GLRSGMKVSSGGVLSGTPAAAGTFAVTVTATDAATKTGSKSLNLVINNSYTISGQITLSGAGLSGVTVTLSTGPTATTNSSGNYSFSNLPTGTYTVTPSLSGYTFTPPSATFTNITANQTANFTAALAVTVTTASLPAGTAGVAYTAFQLTASGGGPPYTWSASGLPSGTNVNSSGVLSGTPAAAGTFAVTVTATDAATKTGSKSLNLVINNSYTI